MSIDQLRRQSLHKNYLETEKKKATLEDGDAGIGKEMEVSLEREIEAKEKLSCIYQTLSRLPLNVRQAFILSRTKGLTYSEIAEQMGVSVSSVEKYILEALKQLRGSLERFDGQE